jgi:hypothetical protein
MIARVFILAYLALAQGLLAQDQRSDLKITAAHRQPGGPAWFVIRTAAHKSVLLSSKDGKIIALSVSAEFPYSVSFYTESLTARYTAVLVFSDRSKDGLIDSFGITSSDDLERTDADTHQRLVESHAQGSALGEKLGKEIRGAHH